MLETAESFFEKTGELSQSGVELQAGIALIVGISLAVLGFRFRRFWMLVLAIFPGLVVGGLVGLSLFILLANSEKFSSLVASTVVGAIAGGVAFAYLGRYLPKVMEFLLIVLTCLLAGSLFQDYLAGGIERVALFAAIGVLAFGLSLWSPKPVLVVVTSAFGTMLFIMGLAQLMNPQFGSLVAELPFALFWSDRFHGDVIIQIREAIEPGYRIYLVLGILTFLVSLPLQLVVTRDLQYDEF
jgi:hypothetical protein